MLTHAVKKNIYILATQSNSGKTLLVASLLRMVNSGGAVASPFKAQNMSLNSYPAFNGGEVALAQAMQAYAAGLRPMVEMNPILLKPMGDSVSEVIVLGKPIGPMNYAEYSRSPIDKWRIVRESMDKLLGEFGHIIGEGAGSAYEPNITGDIANFRPAYYANADVYIVLDISRGGAFTGALGLYNAVPNRWRSLIRGFIINRFRGDPSLLRDAIEWLAEKTGRRVYGVIPEYENAWRLWPEDSEAMVDFGEGPMDVAVVAYPGISNFHEFNILSLERVHVRFVKHPDALGEPDLLILPGAKNTMKAMEWLRRGRLDRKIIKLSGSVPILAICGGFQLLSRRMSDPYGLEFGAPGHIDGLGLVDIEVVYMPDKIVAHSVAVMDNPSMRLVGYEIRRGRIIYRGARPAMTIVSRNGEAVNEPDGYIDEGRRIVATSLHDSLSNPEFRRMVLSMAGVESSSVLTSVEALLRWIDDFTEVVRNSIYIDI